MPKMLSELILVVEDDPALAVGICAVLERAGYWAETSPGAAEALNKMAVVVPQLIVSDIMMPGMDGYEFFRAVRANSIWMSIPFIFLTAKARQADIRLGKELGAEDYLTKPFDPEDLVVAVGARLKRAHDLRQANQVEIGQLKRRILTILSHELRTPLTSIVGYANLVQEEDLTFEQLKDFLGAIQGGSERLHRRIEDFLLLISAEAGEIAQAFRLQSQVEPDLAALIGRVLDRFESAAAVRRVVLHRSLPARLPPVQVHGPLLEDALGRLVDNAVKFSHPEGGTVHVRATVQGSHVFMIVADEGVGIGPDQMPYLFNQFYQVDGDKMAQRGTGLGLAIAKSIVEAHGGSIDVTSRAGQGSTATVMLPVHGGV